MEMNLCKIVQDLLPLYAENLCSPETTQFIEEHIKECEECKKYAEEMTQEIIPESTYDTICSQMKETNDFIKNIFLWPEGENKNSEPVFDAIRSNVKDTNAFIGQLFQKTRRHERGKKLIFAVLLIALLSFILIPLMTCSIRPVPTSEIKVTLESSSGEVPFTFSMEVKNNHYRHIGYDARTENGKEVLYITLKRPILSFSSPNQKPPLLEIRFVTGPTTQESKLPEKLLIKYMQGHQKTVS